ncbi:MAG TPA: hypothetical protein VGP59_09530 [Pyrinomonadaceae bacterium]|nr:hypothetical protein [Pyrinomonadaceae bacterium]
MNNIFRIVDTKNGQAFLYQEKTKDGKESRFSKLIDRDSTDDRGH